LDSTWMQKISNFKTITDNGFGKDHDIVVATVPFGSLSAVLSRELAARYEVGLFRIGIPAESIRASKMHGEFGDAEVVGVFGYDEDRSGIFLVLAPGMAAPKKFAAIADLVAENRRELSDIR
jgi:hypothetical protein